MCFWAMAIFLFKVHTTEASPFLIGFLVVLLRPTYLEDVYHLPLRSGCRASRKMRRDALQCPLSSRYAPCTEDFYHPHSRYRVLRQPQDAKRGRAMQYNAGCLRDKRTSTTPTRGTGCCASRRMRNAAARCNTVPAVFEIRGLLAPPIEVPGVAPAAGCETRPRDAIQCRLSSR
ncbi:hypothetical protein C8R47DRAFT_103480 [Mycena vitilis]|nr:hypothetical protein C8R47DRAFT_103480 [Mycena vitilis]